MIDVIFPSYFKAETHVVELLKDKLAKMKSSTPTNALPKFCL